MTPSTTRNKFLKNFLIAVAVAVFWIGLWWLLALKLDKVYALPTPDKVWNVLIELGGTTVLVGHGDPPGFGVRSAESLKGSGWEPWRGSP